MDTNSNEMEMMSIWTLVGLILLAYGVIITGCGVYYQITGIPQNIAGSSNPSLWWGAIILVAGILFTVFGKEKKA